MQIAHFCPGLTVSHECRLLFVTRLRLVRAGCVQAFAHQLASASQQSLACCDPTMAEDAGTLLWATLKSALAADELALKAKVFVADSHLKMQKNLEYGKIELGPPHLYAAGEHCFWNGARRAV